MTGISPFRDPAAPGGVIVPLSNWIGGAPNASHFTWVFRRVFGMTPTEVRKAAVGEALSP